MKYNFTKIEKKIQSYWYKNNIYKTINNNKDKSKKYYCLVMLPYPSGKLHLGHVRNYTIGDVIARFHRLLGKQVLHPIGWDSFGLPAEQAAIDNNCTPKQWTIKNIKYMKKQLIRLGYSYDWSKEISTCNSNYYKWEQWLFLKLYKKKLIYRKKSFVNWCTYHKTVLANEQVINNNCWRCNYPVIMKKINQWFIKITKYAKELFLGLNKLTNWPKKVLKMQRNWLNPIKGTLVKFYTINFFDKEISIFIKNIELITSITAILISFDHYLVDIIYKKNKNIKNYIKQCISKNKLYKELCLLEINNIKAYNTKILVKNPLNNKNISIWLVNTIYFKNNKNIKIICGGYSKEDNIFSLKYNLKISNFIKYKNNIYSLLEYKLLTSYEKNYHCILINKKDNNISLFKAKKNILKLLIKKNIAKNFIQYRLIDWCISRQRLWGVPIPIIKNNNNKTIMKLKEKDLPLIIKKKKKNKYYLLINNKKICLSLNKNQYLETLDTFIESSWYYIRYISPFDKKKIFNSYLANYWLPIDQYIGGIEHSILHLLYFRFFHKLFRDFNLINSDEPTYNLLCQGMVLGDAFYYLDKNNNYHWISENNLDILRNKEGNIIKINSKINEKKIFFYGKIKMSKSKKNGIDPQHIINKYGSDALRLFILFAAPVKLNLEWNELGIKGMNRFLNRLWNLVNNHLLKKEKIIINKKNNYKYYKLEIIFNKCISKIYKDIKYKLSFNTAIAQIFICLNYFLKYKYESFQDWFIFNNFLKKFLIILYPFIPHIVSILFKKMDNNNKIDNIFWPKIKFKKNKSEFKDIFIQINSKFKLKLKIKNNISFEKLKILILKNKKLLKYISIKSIKNIIFIKNKIFNIII